MGAQLSNRCLPETCKCQCDQTCKETVVFLDDTDEHFVPVSSYPAIRSDPVTETVKGRWQSPNDQFVEAMRWLPEERSTTQEWPKHGLEPPGMLHITDEYLHGRNDASSERRTCKIHNDGIKQLTGRYMSKEAGIGWPIYNLELPHVANLIGGGSPSAVRNESPRGKTGVSARERAPNTKVVEKSLSERNNLPRINLPDRDKEEAAKRERQQTSKAKPGKMLANFMDTDPPIKKCEHTEFVPQTPVGQLAKQPLVAELKPGVRPASRRPPSGLVVNKP